MVTFDLSTLRRIPDRVLASLEGRGASHHARRWLGIDVGARALKLVDVVPTPTGPHVVEARLMERPLSDGHQLLEAQVATLVAPYRGAGVHMAVSGPDVVVRRLVLPLMSHEEVREAVKWQVKDELPFSVEEAVLECEVLGEVWEQEIKKLDVVVAAVPATWLKAQLSLVERAGLHVMSVTPALFASWQVVQMLTPASAQGHVLLVEFGAERTCAAIFKDGQLRLSRDLAVGSHHVTTAMTELIVGDTGAIELNLEQAEGVKCRYGVLEADAQGRTDEGMELSLAASLMRPVLERLLTELSRLADFYKVQMGEPGIDRVLVTGGGAELKHLPEFLHEGLGLVVERYDPLATLPAGKRPPRVEHEAAAGGRLMSALGAALNHGQWMNVMLPEAKEARQRRQVLGLLRRVSMWVGGGIVATAVILQGIGWGIQAQVARQEREWEAREPAFLHAKAQEAERQRLEQAVAAIQGLEDHEPVWDGVLKELGRLMPSNARLLELDASAPAGEGGGPVELHLKGLLLFSGMSVQDSLSTFLGALEESVLFREVQLLSSDMQAGAVSQVSFEIRCTVE